MMAEPMKTLELHYPMIQFLIILNTVSYILRVFIMSEMESKKGQTIKDR